MSSLPGAVSADDVASHGEDLSIYRSRYITGAQSLQNFARNCWSVKDLSHLSKRLHSKDTRAVFCWLAPNHSKMQQDFVVNIKLKNSIKFID